MLIVSHSTEDMAAALETEAVRRLLRSCRSAGEIAGGVELSKADDTADAIKAH